MATSDCGSPLAGPSCQGPGTPGLKVPMGAVAMDTGPRARRSSWALASLRSRQMAPTRHAIRIVRRH